MALLPLSVHDGATTITPYNDTDGVTIAGAVDGGQIICCFTQTLASVMLIQMPIVRQLHEGLGGFDNAMVWN